MLRPLLLAVLFAGVILAPRPAAASDALCDPSFEDCRAPLLPVILAPGTLKNDTTVLAR